MTTVEQHDTIRQMYYNQNISGRQIAKTLGISRQTVSRAIANDTAQTYTLTKPREATKLGAFRQRIADLLLENKRLPKKQRYTATKIFQTLQTEGYTGSESSVQGYCVEWRHEHKRPNTFVPLQFEPGQDAQVDWGCAQAGIAGITQTVQIFVLRLNYSRKVFVRAYPAQKQEAFFDGHIHAFRHLGGVPRRISYDNLAAAVQILADGHTREEKRAFVAFRSHYLFESHFCTPAQGHEKGGVEHAVGFSRRNFMVPIPQVASFEELNAHLQQQCDFDDRRSLRGQPVSIGQAWAAEKTRLRPLPLHQFECCVTRQAALNPYSQIVYDTNRYSVPVEKARSQLVVKAYPFRVDIWHGSELLATHPRLYTKNQDIFDPLHYLGLLEQRPGAFDYARPLKKWQAGWPADYHLLLSRLREKLPEGGRGVKEFIQILKLHQSHPDELVERAVSQALAYGSCNVDAVTHCLHQLTQPQQLTLPLLDLSDKPHLAAVGSQPLDLHAYEQLLERHG